MPSIIPVYGESGIMNEQYFLSSSNGLEVREICGKSETHVILADRSLIRMDPQCSIRTKSFEIKAHRLHTVNATGIHIPGMAASKLLIQELPHLSNATYVKFVLNDTAPVVIHDAAEMHTIIKRTEELLKHEEHEFKLKDLEYDATGWSIGFVLAISPVAIIILVEAFIVFRKFNFMSIAMSSVETATEQLPNLIQSITPGLMHAWLHSTPLSAILAPPTQTLNGNATNKVAAHSGNATNKVATHNGNGL